MIQSVTVENPLFMGPLRFLMGLCLGPGLSGDSTTNLDGLVTVANVADPWRLVRVLTTGIVYVGLVPAVDWILGKLFKNNQDSIRKLWLLPHRVRELFAASLLTWFTPEFQILVERGALDDLLGDPKTNLNYNLYLFYHPLFLTIRSKSIFSTSRPQSRIST